MKPQTDPLVPETPPAAPPRRRFRAHGLVWFAAVVGLVATLVTVAVFGLLGKPLRLPVWVVAEAEARVNGMLGAGEAPGVQVALGGAMVVMDEAFVPRLRLEDVRLFGRGGGTIAALPEVQIALEPRALMEGAFRPQSLRIVGAQITLRRTEDGRFDLAFGGQVDETGPGSFADLLDRVDAAFATSALSALERVEAEALTLTLDDRRAGRLWTVGDGRLTLDNRPGELALEVGMGLVGEDSAPSRATLTFISPKGSSAARLTARVEQVSAADLAAQAPALGWLSVLDAPISGTIAAEFDEAGVIRSGSGTLDIAAGGLHPAEGLRPVAFERAGLAFALDTQAETVTFTDLSVESASLRLKASGRMRVPGLSGGQPEAFVGQVRVADLRVDPEGLFEAPVRFSEGAIDFRLRLDPFRLDLGQIALVEGPTRLTARGGARADAGGWDVALDVGLNEIEHDRLLALWPLALVPKTRAWLTENVQQGLLYDVKGGLRLRPGAEPVLSLGYDFSDADVRFLRTLPPIESGHGYATLIGTAYTIVLDKGEVTPPLGGQIDAAGSVFRVPDITLKPAMAEITMRTRSSITAALSLLDEPPFAFLTKAGYPVDVAEGQAVTVARMRLPLKPKVTTAEVEFTVEGDLTDVTSDKLVKGRVLSADRLRLTANNGGMRIEGPGRLGQAAFDAAWMQDFGPAAKGRSRVEGQVTLSQATLDEFSVRLPEGAVAGTGTGQLNMALEKGGGTFRIESDLRGVALRLAPIALDKAADASAELVVEGRLGTPASIDLVRLKSGAVEAEGNVRLKPDGSLDVARFDRVVSGGWLDAKVDITGKGPGQPVGVAITGGTIDLRRLPGGMGGGGDSAPLDVTLDSLRVTQGISLNNLRGRFATSGGLNGDFTALVNGAAAVSGTVLPDANGTAARIRSDDAGAVLAASGIFQTARGGTMDLTLRPLGPAGVYDGVATLADISVRDAPVLAELLGAISVIGLLEQLNDAGILFSSAEAVFRTGPQGITISSGSAIGASLGVSMAGSYNTTNQTLAMTGVISPVYLLNGIGSILTRPGEGVFGFNYDLTGSVDDPQVAVNPLSILTPGGFREIFRGGTPTRQPPKKNEFR